MRLLRGVLWVGLVLAGGVLALWLQHHPGTLQAEWLGYRLSADARWAVLLLSVVMVLTLILLRILGWIWRTPQRMRDGRTQKRLVAGWSAIESVWVALWTEDRAGAQKALKKAGRLWQGQADDPVGLRGVLEAELALRAGDEAQLRRVLAGLAARPETAYVALCGQAALVIRDLGEHGVDRPDRWHEAVGLAKQANQLRPEAPYAVEILFDLYLRARCFSELEGLLQEVEKHGSHTGGGLKHLRARYWLAQAQAARSREAWAEAMKYAEKAYGQEADWLPAQLLLIELLVLAGEKNQAEKRIEQGWKRVPHPEFILWDRRLHAGWTPDKHLARATSLARMHPGHPESRLWVIEARAATGAWDEAVTDLRALLASHPSPRAWKVAARLDPALLQEQSEHVAVSHVWGGACWRCECCGAGMSHWRPVCVTCGNADHVVWDDGDAADAPVGLTGFRSFLKPFRAMGRG